MHSGLLHVVVLAQVSMRQDELQLKSLTASGRMEGAFGLLYNVIIHI